MVEDYLSLHEQSMILADYRDKLSFAIINDAQTHASDVPLIG